MHFHSIYILLCLHMAMKCNIQPCEHGGRPCVEISSQSENIPHRKVLKISMPRQRNVRNFSRQRWILIPTQMHNGDCCSFGIASRCCQLFRVTILKSLLKLKISRLLINWGKIIILLNICLEKWAKWIEVAE